MDKNHSWQNIGICKKYANEKMPRKYRLTYLDLVEYSFGYGDKSTNRITANDWSKKIGVSKPTFLSHIKYLADNNHIRINVYDGFMKDGGSKPNSYSPTFPKGEIK